MNRQVELSQEFITKHIDICEFSQSENSGSTRKRATDAAWKNMDEPSGRAIAGVHDKAY